MTSGKKVIRSKEKCFLKNNSIREKDE